MLEPTTPWQSGTGEIPALSAAEAGSFLMTYKRQRGYDWAALKAHEARKEGFAHPHLHTSVERGL